MWSLSNSFKINALTNGLIFASLWLLPSGLYRHGYKSRNRLIGTIQKPPEQGSWHAITGAGNTWHGGVADARLSAGYFVHLQHCVGDGGVAGRYDTITVLDSAVLDSGDLANVKGVEALVLAETVNGNSTYRIDLTEAFLLNNTAATNATTTTIDDTLFRIGSANSVSGTALNAGDTVTIDISDLLNATLPTIEYSMEMAEFYTEEAEEVLPDRKSVV